MRDQLSSDLASLRIDRSGETATPASLQSGYPQATRSSSRAPFYKAMVATVAGGLIAAGVIFGVLHAKNTINQTEVELSEVSLVTPAQASVQLSGTGYAVPQTLVKLQSKLPGRIEQVNVREGAIVNRGDVLFVLDAEAKKNAVRAAESKAAAASARAASARANLNALQRRFEREQKLVASGAVSRAGVDDLKDQVESARAGYLSASADAKALLLEKKALDTDLSDLTVPSPINGRAITKPMNRGDMASPDKTLIELADFESMAVEVDVAEARLEQVKSGTPCEIVLDAFPSRRLRGEVFEINPRIDRAKATGTVKVKLLDGVDIVLPGMSARVNFLTRPLNAGELGEAAKKVIPADAVVHHGSSTVAFTIEDGHAREVPLVLGAAVAGGFEVKEGPGPGTRVIRSPPAKLTSGQSVKEKTEK